MRRLAWLVAMMVGLAIAAPPAAVEAAPRTRAHKGVVKPAKRTPAKKTKAKKVAAGKKRPTRAAAATKRSTPSKTATRPGKLRGAQPIPHPDLARVTIAGAVRGPSEPRGRIESVASTPAERTADAIDKLLQGPLRYGTTGLYVVDAATGHELFAMHPDDPLNPASNVKLVSTAAALDLLGPDFRYTTRLLGPIPSPDGVVAGDVYLNGTYDPTLGARGLRELATAIVERGVRRIEGDLVVGSVGTRDGLYRAGVSVHVAAGAPGEPPLVTVSPASDFIEVVNDARSGKRAKVKGRLDVSSKLVDRNGRARLQITVTGAIGKGKSADRYLSTRERALFAAHLVKAGLREAGVEVTGDVHVAELDAFVAAGETAGHLPIVLAQRESLPLADIISQVNKRSINWLSDRVIATAAALTADRQPSMADGVEAMYAWLGSAAGVTRKEAVLDTGSGLSYRTELSPRQIVAALRVATGADAPTDAHRAACAAAFRRSLSIAGVDGTLRGRFHSPLRGRVIGKTGTLTGVIALSGLLEGADGRALAFSIVTNGHDNRRKRSIRQAHEQLLGLLDRYLAETQAAAPATTPAIDVVPAVPMAAPADDADDEGDDEASDDGVADPARDPAAGAGE